MRRQPKPLPTVISLQEAFIDRMLADRSGQGKVRRAAHKRMRLGLIALGWTEDQALVMCKDARDMLALELAARD